MRDELAIDWVNEAKHTVELNAADRMSAQIIFYVALYVPDIGKHGSNIWSWPGARLDVRRFFDQQRDFVSAGGSRSVASIAGLDPRIRPYLAQYSYGERLRYWPAFFKWASPQRTVLPAIYTLDTCNGVANGSNRETRHLRIRSDEVATVWQHLRPGDVLLIYQSADRAKVRYARPLELISSATGVQIGDLQVHDFGNFAMIELVKPMKQIAPVPVIVTDAA